MESSAHACYLPWKKFLRCIQSFLVPCSGSRSSDTLLEKPGGTIWIDTYINFGLKLHIKQLRTLFDSWWEFICLLAILTKVSVTRNTLSKKKKWRKITFGDLTQRWLGVTSSNLTDVSKNVPSLASDHNVSWSWGVWTVESGGVSDTLNVIHPKSQRHPRIGRSPMRFLH